MIALIYLFFSAEIGDFEDHLGGNYLNGLKLLPRQVRNSFILVRFHFDYLALTIFVEYCEVFGFKEFQIFFIFGLTLINMFPGNIYLFKVNNKNTRKRCEICLKLTIKTPEWHQWRCSGVFIVNFEYISYLFLVLLLLTVNK